MSDSESELDLQEIIACPGVYREIPVPEKHINNKPALLNTLEHISNKLPWIERLDVVTQPAPAAKELDVPDDPSAIDPDDDFKRENYFYRLAQAAVLVAIPRLHELDIPTKRPTDYFAEMVKSDQHMNKIKQHLLETQERLSLRERARQIREKRRFGKETQQAVLQARRAEKRQLTEAIKASRKKTGKNQAEVLDELLNSFQDHQEVNSASKKKKQQQQQQPGGFHRAKDVANRRKVNYRRDYKNKKFGHGGQKKRSKRNTVDSTGVSAFRRDFDVLKHQATPKKAQQIRLERRKSNQKLRKGKPNKRRK